MEFIVNYEDSAFGHAGPPCFAEATPDAGGSGAVVSIEGQYLFQVIQEKHLGNTKAHGIASIVVNYLNMASYGRMMLNAHQYKKENLVCQAFFAGGKDCRLVQIPGYGLLDSLGNYL